jgi:hypothetical protein
MLHPACSTQLACVRPPASHSRQPDHHGARHDLACLAGGGDAGGLHGGFRDLAHGTLGAEARRRTALVLRCQQGATAPWAGGCTAHRVAVAGGPMLGAWQLGSRARGRVRVPAGRAASASGAPIAATVPGQADMAGGKLTRIAWQSR